MARKWWTLTVAGMFMLGFLAFSTALAALVYGLISAGGGWGSAKVIVSLGAAAGLLAAFVLIEAAQRRPMLDLSLFRVPTFTGGLLAAFGISASLFSLLTYIILYLQDAPGSCSSPHPPAGRHAAGRARPTVSPTLTAAS